MIINKEVSVNTLFETWIRSPYGSYPTTHQELIDEMKPLAMAIEGKPFVVVTKALEFQEDNPVISIGELVALRRLMVDQVPHYTKMILRFIITTRKVFITYEI